jgi:V-type H+-transporting ATPase proteolipid subunit
MPDLETGACRYSQFTGYAHLCAGLCVGLASLASGISLGIASDAGVRANAAQSSMNANWKKMGFSASGDGAAGGKQEGGDSLYIAGLLVQVFASNGGLYALILALIASQSEYVCDV